MGPMSATTVLWFLGYWLFVSSQQMHCWNFEGASLSFKRLLCATVKIGEITGIVFLVFYGWTVKWWAPLALVGISLLAIVPRSIVERLFGRFFLSMAGFIGWPVCAVYMFRSIK